MQPHPAAAASDGNRLLNGAIPNNVYNSIYQDNINRSNFDQDTFQFVVDGSLFELQGGTVKAALGAEHRRDHIKDTPSEAALAGELYNRASAGITKGSDAVNELFGEIQIQFVKEKPFANLFEIDASGRYTHYKSYGSDFTYHLNAQWEPIRELRLRGNYGTNFRAPNLYEQFVADQTGFYPPSIDPCDEFAASFAPGSTRYNNCLAALEPILGNAGALSYVSSTGPEVTTRGGRDNLTAETAKTWGFGAIFTMPRHIADFSLAVDYWNIKVKDEVSMLVTGYQLKPNTDASLAVGPTQFAMYTQNDGAWVKNAADEPRLIDSMRKGSDLVIKGTSGRGTQSTDTYALKGIAQALDRANQQCQQ